MSILPQMLNYQQQQPSTNPQATPAVPLPFLDGHPNRKFLQYEPITAGRAVILELYPPRFVDERQLHHLMDKHLASDEAELGHRMGIWLDGTPIQFAWKRFEDRLDFEEVGRAAQELERAGFNWRQAQTFDEVLAAFSALPQAQAS